MVDNIFPYEMRYLQEPCISPGAFSDFYVHRYSHFLFESEHLFLKMAPFFGNKSVTGLPTHIDKYSYKWNMTYNHYN